MNSLDKAYKLIDLLNSKGYEGFLVGGCVRDMILGKTPKDFDITTSATTKEMREIFKNYSIIPSGEKFAQYEVIPALSKKNDEKFYLKFKSHSNYYYTLLKTESVEQLKNRKVSLKIIRYIKQVKKAQKGHEYSRGFRKL